MDSCTGTAFSVHPISIPVTCPCTDMYIVHCLLCGMQAGHSLVGEAVRDVLQGGPLPAEAAVWGQNG